MSFDIENDEIVFEFDEVEVQNAIVAFLNERTGELVDVVEDSVRGDVEQNSAHGDENVQREDAVPAVDVVREVEKEAAGEVAVVAEKEAAGGSNGGEKRTEKSQRMTLKVSFFGRGLFDSFLE